ncbi:MAG: hypothetical protein IKZ59_07520 [Clostridia bacterium]|nr:hypothetical protein [Clostridia bacterium]
MQNSSASFLKGMGTGMVAGAAAIVVGKTLIQDKHNISKGSAKLIKAMGQIVDGVQTMFK